MASKYVSSENTTNSFDRVEELIRSTFGEIIRLASVRRDQLLEELNTMKNVYRNKEEARIKQLTELDKMIKHMKDLNIQQNQSLKIQQDQIIALTEEQTRNKQPTSLPVPAFNAEGGYCILQQLERFGALQDIAILYLEKIRPTTRYQNKGRDKGVLTGQVGLTLDDIERVYVADLSNKCIQLLSADGELKGRFGKGHVVTPYSIALYDKWIFLCDRNINSLIRFSQDNFKFVNKSVEGELNYPQGITADYNGDVHVADGYRNRVAVFSLRLEFIREIGKGLLRCPRDVKIALNTIYVADNNNTNNVHIFSRSGDVLRSMIKLENGSSNIFFCLDKFLNILVSDYAANSIQIYTSYGELMHRIDCEGHPTGIAVNSYHSIVCARFDYVISIY